MAHFGLCGPAPPLPSLTHPPNTVLSVSASGAAFPVTIIRSKKRKSLLRFKNKQAFCCLPSCSYPSSSVNNNYSRVQYDSLKVLEWDKICDSVASFTRSSLGRDATKAQLWSLNKTFEDSLKLLDETNAAIEMHKHGSCSLDLTGVDLTLVKSAIQHARRALPLSAKEALAVVTLLQFADALQLNLKAAIKQDADWYNCFMPLTEMIMQLVVNRSLLKLIQQVIDEDGTVKDSASSALKRSRDQVRFLERKLHQLMDNLIRKEIDEASVLEVSAINGRWCITSGADQTSIKGLLISSGSRTGSILEPLVAVPLNDELQQARALVAKAEADVLLMLTEKMKMDLDEVERILNCVIQLDVINARATYSLSFGGTCPDIFLEKNIGSLTAEGYSVQNKSSKASYTKQEWILYLPKAYHPLLLQQHRQNLRKAQKDVIDATAEIRRRKLQGENTIRERDINLSSLKMQVNALEQAHPVPVEFFIAQQTRVVVITGPNTGGKTICLKTVGLAAMMAKSGLHVLCSEPACIPWFDSVFADIGDEQSLLQSLSTFSGHLKQISDIQSHSTSRSLVLLDEVGAGTNPLEGAALGMSLLESFAGRGALLTVATTHHGELKTLKYSNGAFENACMEFDEVNLKPTYKILWGVPGRSNAIKIAERLGLPSLIVDNARELYGAASAEINEVIIDMERFKQEFQELLYGSRHYLKISREYHEDLLLARRMIMGHSIEYKYKKIGEISIAASRARSILHRIAQQLRASTARASPSTAVVKSRQTLASNYEHTVTDNSEYPARIKGSSAVQFAKQSPAENLVKETEIPEVGDVVHISSLGKKATVLRIEPSKEELLVQAGNMKLKLKLMDVEI